MTCAVVFDMDGVLVHTTPYHVRVWSEWFETVPYAPGPGGVAAVLGRRGEDALVDIMGEDHSPGVLDALVTAEDVRTGKPDPEVYLAAARRLGVEPARCTAVEDAAPGVRAARAAGMRVVAVTSTADADALRDAGADLVVDSLEQLTVEALCPNET